MSKKRFAAGVAGGVLVGAIIGGLGAGAVMANQPASEPKTIEVEVESTATEVCRGLAFNLANEVYQLVGLVAAERAGDREHVDERLEVHMANWGDKVQGMAPVCGIDLPGER